MDARVLSYHAPEDNPVGETATSTPGSVRNQCGSNICVQDNPSDMDIVEEYRKRYSDYDFRIKYAHPDRQNMANGALEVVLQTRDGARYSANLVTRQFVDYSFEKNKRTGENAGGVYFCMPNIIIVEEIDEHTVRKVIDDLIGSVDIDDYFKPM